MRQSVLEAAARGAHECCRAMELATGSVYSPHWEQLTKTAQEGILKATRLVSEGLTAREIHEAKLFELKKEGWAHGDKDLVAKTHPNIVSWDALPPSEQSKVQLFTSAVRTMLSAFPLRMLR